MRLLDRITVNPEICHGSPTIRGLRYPVSMIMGLLPSGMTTDEVLADYADLERDDVLAALDAHYERDPTRERADIVIDGTQPVERSRTDLHA